MQTRIAAVMLLSLVSLAGCGDRMSPAAPEDTNLPPGTAGPLDGGPIIPHAVGGKIRGGGFDDASNVGSIPGTQWGPSGWFFLAGSATGITDFNGVPDACVTDGNCQTGNLQQAISTLGVPSNPDPNPDPIGGVSQLFAVEYVGPFTSRDAVAEVSRKSGVRRSFTLPDDSGWELSFDWAFLSGQLNTGAAHNDYATVTAVFSDGTADKALFRISRDDLQPGGSGATSALNNAACATGTVATGGSAYNLCTGWQYARIDVSAVRGKTFEIQIVLNKALEEGTGSWFAFDNVQFTGVALPTVPISLGAFTTFPANVVAGRDATLCAAITGGVVTPAPGVQWTWGDGGASAGSVSTDATTGARTATGTHAFVLPGTYDAEVRVTAADGGTSSRRESIVVKHRSGAIVLLYVCGNQFRLRNHYPAPMAVTYDVNKVPAGTLVLPAKPTSAAYSETTFTTSTTGTVRVFLGDQLIQTKANGGIACPA